MTTCMIRDLAGQYRISPEKREEILYHIYKCSGKSGLYSFTRFLGSKSARPFIRWVENYHDNKKRCRRNQKLKNVQRPPAPPDPEGFKIYNLFDEKTSVTGSKFGKQGGKRSIYNGQSWDAINGGGK